MSCSWKVGCQRLLMVLFCLALGACATAGSQHLSSNVVSYLYPSQKQPSVTPMQTGMSLPVKVAVAFVPEQGLTHRALTEGDKLSLKTRVAAHFEQQSFVSQVTLVPSAYLIPGGSFGNLDQLRRMYGVDMIVLLSYDRTQFDGTGSGTVTYWTLEGAQLISGDKNATYTLLDAAVYDIGERQMLFRAPGSSLIQYQLGPLSLAEQLRQDSLSGFEQASVDLMSNLRQQVGLFRARQVHSSDGAASAGAAYLSIPDTHSEQ